MVGRGSWYGVGLHQPPGHLKPNLGMGTNTSGFLSPCSLPGLTFDALLEPLAAPFIGPPPGPLLSGLFLVLCTIFALGKDRGFTQNACEPAFHSETPKTTP